MKTLLSMAFLNMVRAKRRSFLLGLTIALVAMLFLFLRAVSHSVSDRMIYAATTLSSGHVNVGGFFKPRKKAAYPLLADRDEIRQFVKEHVPEAVTIIDRHRGWGRLIGPASSINVGLNGIIPEEEERFFKSLRLAEENEYLDNNHSKAVHGDFKGLKERNTVLLFAAQAKKLGVSVGDNVTIVTEMGTTNALDLKVVAIASDIGFMSNWNAFVPRQTVIDLYKVAEKTTGAVMVYLKSAEQSVPVMERLKADFKAKGYTVMDYDPKPFFMKFEKVAGEDWLGQQLDLTTWSDEISFVLWITHALDLVSFFIISVLAIIIIGGIVNAMWMSVRERAKEIGTMRAIGSQKSFVLQLFVYEAAWLGLVASFTGAAIGTTLIAILNAAQIPITSQGVRLFLMTNTLEIEVTPGQFVSTMLLFVVMTAFAALYPALKAARMRPVEALMQTK